MSELPGPWAVWWDGLGESEKDYWFDSDLPLLDEAQLHRLREAGLIPATDSVTDPAIERPGVTPSEALMRLLSGGPAAAAALTVDHLHERVVTPHDPMS